MRRDREGRRTVVQFLSGLAVGTVATLVLAPLASGYPQVRIGDGVPSCGGRRMPCLGAAGRSMIQPAR